MENAVQVRMTPDGVDFLENNLADIIASATGGTLLFPVPPTSQSIVIGTVNVCPDNDCFINIEIREANLVPTPPNELRLHMNVAAWTSDATGSERALAMEVDTWLPPDPAQCGAWVDTRASGSPVMPVTGAIVFVIDTETRYTEIEFVDLDATSGFEESDVWIEGDAFRCDMIGWFQGFFVDSLTSALDEQLSGAIGEFTCRSCETAANCPDDATCEEGVCMRGDECVASLLGIEGRMDLGALSAMFQGELDLLVAAGGYAEAVEGGLSLGLMGGAEAVEPSSCVPHDVTPPPLGPVPVSPTLRVMNECADCTPSEVAIALGVSETFLNRFGYGMHQAGGLCLTLGGDTLPISSGTLALLMPSLRNVTWGEGAPVAIELRPNQPPLFELGPSTEEDPLLAVTLNDASLDFYVWAHDRYVRMMQANLDLTVDMDLAAEAGEIQINVRGLHTDNLSIRHADILDEDLTTLADAFGTLITDMVTPMLGDLGGFALPDMMGFSLQIPDGGMSYLEDEGEEFLAIYAALAIAETPEDPPPFPRPMSTGAEVRELFVPATGVFGGLEGPRQIPRVTLGLSSDGDGATMVEYRTRVDGGFWSPWCTDTEVVLEDPHFLFQGRHRVLAQARVVGQPETADPEPARLEVIIDSVAPELQVRQLDGHLVASAWDMVTPEELIAVEWRPVGDETYRPMPTGGLAIPELDGDVELRATDEAGNVAVGGQALRGRIPTDPESCGGCAMTHRGGKGAALLGLFVLIGLALLRRRGDAAVGVVAVVASSTLVVACSGPAFRCDPDDEACCDEDSDCENGRCCDDGHYCVEFTRELDSCEVGFHCDAPPPLNDDCEYLSCDNCVEGDEIYRGLIGAHSSVVVTPGGDVWAAGYAAGQSYNRTYGDLAIAFVEGRSERVPVSAWTAVDGVPADGEVLASPTGFRGGIEEPGDDVGLYASIDVDSAGNPAVAYYDRTHKALMFIAGTSEMWGAPVLVDGGDGTDAGRFADLLIRPDGRPAIAYMVIERNGDGSIVTRARYIEATVSDGSAWNPPVDLHVLDPTPCSMAVCSDDDDEVCDVESNRCVVPSEDCGDPGCASGEACIGGECRAVIDGAPDLPEGTGIWPELAQGPGSTMGVVFYDRTNGDLVSAAYDGAGWGPPHVLAGDGSDGMPVGDMGWAPSLFIDDRGVWHMSYVDGLTEDLRYLSSEGLSEVVDGRSLGTHWNIRGDDSSIYVSPTGDVRIAYQDATDLGLWISDRDSTGLWSTRQLVGVGLPEGSTQGFYVNQVPAGTSSLVSAWYWDPTSMQNAVLLFWI